MGDQTCRSLRVGRFPLLCNSRLPCTCHKHATQDVSQYGVAAIEQGLTVLGISDHTALPDNRWPHIRMGIEELPDYIRSVDEAIKSFPELTILKAAECEYADEYHSFFEDILLREHRFDYLVGAAYYFPMDDKWQGSDGGSNSKAALQSWQR